MVKIAGQRASLEALNCELLRVRGVRDGVFFLPEDAEQHRLAALVVASRLDSGRHPAGAARTHRSRVPAAPAAHGDALPRNATGKLAREVLLALAARRSRGTAARLRGMARMPSLVP